jgi:type II secretory pathway component PulJ
MADMNEERKYRKRMGFTVMGVLLSIPLFLAILFLVLSFFFNPFHPE